MVRCVKQPRQEGSLRNKDNKDTKTVCKQTSKRTKFRQERKRRCVLWLNRTNNGLYGLSEIVWLLFSPFAEHVLCRRGGMVHPIQYLTSPPRSTRIHRRRRPHGPSQSRYPLSSPEHSVCTALFDRATNRTESVRDRGSCVDTPHSLQALPMPQIHRPGSVE